MGGVGCFSFYANKIITCGEGGMIVTNDPGVAERAQSLRNLSFAKGARIYQHSDIGYNYRMTNIQAAIGLAQFERIDELVAARRKNAHLYSKLLEGVRGVTLPVEMPWAKSVYWMYSIIIYDDFVMNRDSLMDALMEQGIETRPFFIPMHKQVVFQRMGMFAGEEYPVAERLSKQGMYLPSSSGLSENEIKFVCNTIKKLSR
jgi:perosamine synthetase